MDLSDFVARLRSALPVGRVLDNPGGGTSTVLWVDDERLCYQRGQARFYVRLSDLYAALARFAGAHVTTTDLKRYAPTVFDSSQRGHNCNCTMLFLALQKMDLAGAISGRGRRGDPFGVSIPNVTHGS